MPACQRLHGTAKRCSCTWAATPSTRAAAPEAPLQLPLRRPCQRGPPATLARLHEGVPRLSHSPRRLHPAHWPAQGAASERRRPAARCDGRSRRQRRPLPSSVARCRRLLPTAASRPPGLSPCGVVEDLHIHGARRYLRSDMDPNDLRAPVSIVPHRLARPPCFHAHALPLCAAPARSAPPSP